MRPNILYLIAALSTRVAADEAPSNNDLHPSIWCSAAFLYPRQDRPNNIVLKNVFHGFCGLKGYEVSTDIELNQCLDNVNGQVHWKENPNPAKPTLSSSGCCSAPPEHPQSFQQSQHPQHPIISQQQQLQQQQQQQQQQQVAPPQQNQPKQKQPRKPRQPRKQAQQQQQQQQQVQQQVAPPQQQLVGIDAQRFAQLQAEVGQLHQLVQGIIHRLDAYGVPSLPGGHHAPLLLPQQHAVPVSAAGTSTLGAATANSATNNTINFNALLQAGTSHDVGGSGGGESSGTGVGGVSGLVNGDHGHHHHDDGSGGNMATHHQDDGMGDNDMDDDDDEESRQLQLLSANLAGDQSLGPSVSWDAGASSGSGAGAAGFDMAYPPQGHIFHIQLSTSAGGKNYVGGGPNGASHGYRIKNDRYHLTMSCALSGNKYRPVPGPTQEQIEEARRNGQRKPYQRRIGTDKFVSTFEVRWTMVGPDQQPAMHNHGPDPKALVGDE
ncbi:hypothetical protein QBC45DRAFT_455101 [Copromyces sp. CBS 386.78]|nr:hypothetical protein QBC45DRAFT_455101 [Copromyces sp. CBS 386.78]